MVRPRVCGVIDKEVSGRARQVCSFMGDAAAHLLEHGFVDDADGGMVTPVPSPPSTAGVLARAVRAAIAVAVRQLLLSKSWPTERGMSRAMELLLLKQCVSVAMFEKPMLSRWEAGHVRYVLPYVLLNRTLADELKARVDPPTSIVFAAPKGTVESGEVQCLGEAGGRELVLLMQQSWPDAVSVLEASCVVASVVAASSVLRLDHLEPAAARQLMAELQRNPALVDAVMGFAASSTQQEWVPGTKPMLMEPVPAASPPGLVAMDLPCGSFDERVYIASLACPSAGRLDTTKVHQVLDVLLHLWAAEHDLAIVPRMLLCFVDAEFEVSLASVYCGSVVDEMVEQQAMAWAHCVRSLAADRLRPSLVFSESGMKAAAESGVRAVLLCSSLRAFDMLLRRAPGVFRNLGADMTVVQKAGLLHLNSDPCAVAV